MSPGVLDGLPDHLLGNFVERHPMGLRLGKAQQFLQMPGDGFPLPVRVSCQIHGIGLFRRLPQFCNDLLLAGDLPVFGLEVVFNFHAHGAFGQIPKMAHAGLHCKAGTQIFSDGSSPWTATPRSQEMTLRSSKNFLICAPLARRAAWRRPPEFPAWTIPTASRLPVCPAGR